MARTRGVQDSAAGFVVRRIYAAVRRKVGRVPDPLRIMAESRGVLFAACGFELGFERARSVEPRLKDLAQLKAASMIGCVF